MLSLHDALLGLGAPALLGVVICWLVRRRKPALSVHAPASLADAGFATGLALCFGFTIGYCGVHSLPKMPPSEALEWLVLAATGMFFLMVLDQYVWRSSRFVFGSQLAIVGAAISLIVWLIAKNGWPIGQTIGWIAGSCAVAGVLLLGLKPACKHNLPIAVTVSLTALTLFAAGVLGMSGSQTYGLQAATMPAVLVPLAILSIWRRATLFTPTCLPAFVLLYGGMLLCGYLYTNLTTVNALLLLAAPLGLLAGLLPAIRRLDDWRRAAIPMLAAIIPGAIAFGLALHQFLIDMSDSLPFQLPANFERQKFMSHLALRRDACASSGLHFAMRLAPIVGLTVTPQSDRFNRLQIVLSSVAKRVSRCFGHHRSVKAFMM